MAPDDPQVHGDINDDDGDASDHGENFGQVVFQEEVVNVDVDADADVGRVRLRQGRTIRKITHRCHVLVDAKPLHYSKMMFPVLRQAYY